MGEPYKITDADEKFATKLLQDAWRVEGPPISKYVLANILANLGLELRTHAAETHGVLWYAQRYLVMEEWLNTSREGGNVELEPPIRTPPSLVRRFRWWIRDHIENIKRGIRGE